MLIVGKNDIIIVMSTLEQWEYQYIRKGERVEIGSGTLMLPTSRDRKKGIIGSYTTISDRNPYAVDDSLITFYDVYPDGVVLAHSMRRIFEEGRYVTRMHRSYIAGTEGQIQETPKGPILSFTEALLL